MLRLALILIFLGRIERHLVGGGDVKTLRRERHKCCDKCYEKSGNVSSLFGLTRSRTDRRNRTDPSERADSQCEHHNISHDRTKSASRCVKYERTLKTWNGIFRRGPSRNRLHNLHNFLERVNTLADTSNLSRRQTFKLKSIFY